MNAPTAPRTPTRLFTLGLTIAAATLGSSALRAQAPLAPPSMGPVIEGFGPVWDVPFLEVPVDTERERRIVFEVADSPGEPGEVNPRIETLARFLNMHARAGVPVDRMQLAIVLHGSAAKDALRPAVFAERYDGAVNRNAELLRALADAGVEIYMCGQSAMSRGLHDDDLMEEVRMALSAMTIMGALKEDGYREVN